MTSLKLYHAESLWEKNAYQLEKKGLILDDKW